jgi:DNA-binding NarL/FixJ family response regulator
VVEHHAGQPVELDRDVDLVLYDTYGAAALAHEEVAAIQRHTSARLVVYSWATDPELVQRSLAAGAAGFLPKSLAPETLVTRLEQIHRQAATGSGSENGGAGRSARWPGAEEGLTHRESEIVALIARGLSNRDIADRTHLSINSVKTYIRTAYRKMGVKTRPRAVLWAIRHGFEAQPSLPLGATDGQPVRG